MNKALNTWMAAATTEEQHKMADLAGTTRGTLYQYSGGNRRMSSERAIQVEAATKKMSARTKGRLPEISRTQLSAACATCSFARQCKGGMK